MAFGKDNANYIPRGKYATKWQKREGLRGDYATDWQKEHISAVVQCLIRVMGVNAAAHYIKAEITLYLIYIRVFVIIMVHSEYEVADI